MSFITLLLYITAIYIRPQEWVPQIYGWPLINILAIVTAFCVLIEAGMNQKLRVNEPQIILLLAFLGCIVMSHLSHGYLGGAWDSFLKFGPNVVMFFLFVNALNTEKRIKIAIWLIIILTAVLAVQGIYQYNHGFGWAGQPLSQVTKETPNGRITWIGIFNDPNDLALTFVVAIGFLISFIFNKSAWLIKIASVPLAALLIYSLYLTNSRGGYLAFAATIGYFFLRKFKNKFVAIAIGTILAFVVLLVGPSRMADVSAEEDSAQGRIEAWYSGFQMLKSAPLFGVGYGMFTDYHDRTAHNSYILVAAEEGLVGMVVWIALIYICFKGFFAIRSQENASLNFNIQGLEAALFGFLCSAYFLSRAYIAILYLIIALASATSYLFLKKNEYSYTLKDLGIVSAISSSLLVMTFVSMKLSLK